MRDFLILVVVVIRPVTVMPVAGHFLISGTLLMRSTASTIYTCGDSHTRRDSVVGDLFNISILKNRDHCYWDSCQSFSYPIAQSVRFLRSSHPSESRNSRTLVYESKAVIQLKLEP
jgi:hypothetical protein